ncbi:MAG: DUF72 domain-containing protein [Actinomycetota bacterium]|nr:MAG: DUF72 domain-containing protein [Actinomycetota bacterium]
MTELLLGTSGYSYSDWIGPFYPERLGKSEQLSFYSKFFNTVEINLLITRYPTPIYLRLWPERSRTALYSQ